MDLRVGGIVANDRTVALEVSAVYQSGDPEYPPGGFALDIVSLASNAKVGSIPLRTNRAPENASFVGNLAYEIDAAYRGQGYASKACRLVVSLACTIDLDPLWIMVSVDNPASAKVARRAGAVLVGEAEVPNDSDLRDLGITRVWRFRLSTGSTAVP